MENPNIPNIGPMPSEDKIEPSTDVSLYHLSDNPWRRVCDEKWDKVADWTEQSPVYYAIETLHLLNKLSESNFETIASKFCNFQNEYSDNMETIANLFFTKSISEPLYTKLYCCLLKKLFDSKETNKNALNLILLISTQCNLIIFSSANKEFDLEEMKFDQLKLEGTFSLYYELFSLNLVTLSSFLMILFGFLQSSRSNNLPFVVQVIQKCGEKVERDVRGKNRSETLVWTQILDLIESKCKFQKDFLTRRTYLMLSNILLLKERSWESALTKSVINDDAVCEIVEQAPQKRPSKKETKKERKENQRLAMQQKALVTNDGPACETEEQAPERRPSKKERKKENKEKRLLALQQKALFTNDVPTRETEEQAPQKRPSKKERRERTSKKEIREERKEKEEGFFSFLQEKTLVTNDVPTCKAEEKAPQKKDRRERTSKKEIRKEIKEKATPLVDTRNKEPKKKNSKVEEEEIELNSCDDPWKPIFIRMKKLKRKEKIPDHELFMMNAKSLLNKLDLDNYSSISEQFLELDFKEKNVGLIIDYLLIKASNEGGLYGEKYAELIREMYDLVKPDSNQNETVFASNAILKRSTLKKIKRGIENVLDQVNYYLIPQMKQDSIVEELDDPDTGMNMDLKNQLTNALLFIGALFKQDLVDMKQVLSTICMNLIQEVNEKCLESLVIFLSKVGKKIDENKKSFTVFQSEWEKVMTVIDTAIVERSNISNKTYFMLLNFVDLSRREWVPRVIHIAEPQFSASGLIEREKLRFKDVRNKQNISLYYAKELNYLNVSKDPWQRGCFKRKQNEDALQVKTLKTILNQINGGNFESCSFQFNRRCKMKKENIYLYVCLIFEQCMSNSKYIDIFLKLIRSHVAYKVENKGSEKKPGLDEFAFVDLFVEKSIRTFNEHKTRGTEHDVLLNNCTVIAKLFTYNLVDLNLLLDLLMNFLDHPTELTLLCLAKIVLLCGREIEKQTKQKEITQMKWMEILKGIEIVSASSREEISNRTYLMLTNVMIMKNKNWVSKIDLDTEMATECRWKRDLDEITTETKWKSRTKQYQPRHVIIQESVRNEQEENIVDKELKERKEEFMVQDILKDLGMVDNPWRRGEFKRELTEKDRITMEAKTLLNKLAENNFESIVDQFCKLIFLPGTIDPIVNTLFVKGILETKFTELHAKFVKSVSDNMNNMATGGTKVDAKEETVSAEEDKAVEFDLRTRILNKGAMEIYYLHSESNVISDEIYNQKRLNLDMARPDFEELLKNREKNDFLMHHREFLKKKISVGTCHFLGELYNADVVDTGFILTTIVCDLLPYDSEESLECAIKLISVVGKKLERVIKKSLNKDYLAGWDIVLEDIATKASRRDQWSNRVYFMLLDLLDLKERDWLPRLIIIPTRHFKTPKKSRGY